MLKQQQNSFLQYWSLLIAIYLLSISFQTIFSFPFIGNKLQLPEIIFLFTCIFLLLNLKKIPFDLFTFNLLDRALMAYLGVTLITAFFANNIHPFLEFFGLLYLLINYFLIRLFFISIPQRMPSFISKNLIGMGLIAAFFGLVGLGLTYFGGENPLGYVYKNYPYLGDVIRVNGFTSTPNMLASILNVSIIFLLINIFEKRNLRLFSILSILLTAYFFTFAKIIILLFIGVIFLIIQKQQFNLSAFTKFSLRFIALSFFILYLVGTHFIFVKKTDLALEEIKKSAFNTGVVVGKTASYEIIPTSYLTLKQSTYYLGKEHFFTGVGVGNHGIYFKRLKEEGLFPKHIPNYDPHSTYFGSFAETGIFGLLAILYLTFVLFKISRFLLKTSKYNRLVLAVSSCLVIFIMEAISVDAMNFRHLWLLFAILSAVYNLEQNDQLELSRS